MSYATSTARETLPGSRESLPIGVPLLWTPYGPEPRLTFVISTKSPSTESRDTQLASKPNNKYTLASPGES